MNFTIAFVTIFAAVCVFVTALAIIRILKTKYHPYKLLWIAGCIFGFVGFGLAPASSDDLLTHFGVQVPVVIGMWSNVEGISLKAMFPLIAVVALFRLYRVRAKENLLD